MLRVLFEYSYNIALRCHRLNMFVVAACQNLQSPGAQQLATLLPPARHRLVQLDLCNLASIHHVRHTIETLLADQPRLQLAAVVNNAGRMVFGEFEWQTDAQIQQQITVNLLGTMRMTHAVLPLCRQHGARIIIVSSHCAHGALPSLAPYAASKAALRSFADALRVEQRKYGVAVVDFVPGSFMAASNIAAGQQQHATEQRDALTAEQRAFYGEYFERFHGYLGRLSGERQVLEYAAAGEARMMAVFEAALLESRPRAMYKNEPSWRYRVYHWLFDWTPTAVRDWLVVKFVQMPTFEERK